MYENVPSTSTNYIILIFLIVFLIRVIFLFQSFSLPRLPTDPYKWKRTSHSHIRVRIFLLFNFTTGLRVDGISLRTIKKKETKRAGYKMNQRKWEMGE